MFKTGSLEVTSEIRSVPLGEKKKKGRPKKIQHCLSKSPPMSTLAALESDGDMDLTEEEFAEEEVADKEVAEEAVAVEEVANEEVIDLGVRTRKRKQPGLGVSKPPKKRPRLPVPTVQPSLLSAPSSSSAPPKSKSRSHLPASVLSTTLACSSSAPTPAPPSTSTPPTATSVKPVPKKCKKKIGSCNHEIVFENHYDRKEWNNYANSVRLAKSLTQIDPEYMA